jgi:hypothetical protein
VLNWKVERDIDRGLSRCSLKVRRRPTEPAQRRP